MVVGDNKSTTTKNAGKSMAILIAMAMQRYDAGHIARWSTSRASLEATGCHHRASACTVSPRRPPWSKNLNQTQKTLDNKTQLLASNGTFQLLDVCENFNPKTNPLLSSSMQQAWCKYETPRLELESSATFIVIKRCHWTKIGKVNKQSQRLIYRHNRLVVTVL